MKTGSKIIKILSPLFRNDRKGGIILFLRHMNLADNWKRIDTLTRVIIRKSRADSLFRKNGAVYFYGRKSVESLNNGVVSEFEGVVD